MEMYVRGGRKRWLDGRRNRGQDVWRDGGGMEREVEEAMDGGMKGEGEK